MRLINTETLRVETLDGEVPEYAILSHTWGKKEVLFQDMQDLAKARHMAGFAKIEQACAVARSGGYAYIWIDTCCIDKTSSAELSEAINSMYNWYKEADVCYAYLNDCDVDRNHTDFESNFRRARWFTRGWTLQELIAPRRLNFYSSNWTELGGKDELQALISETTGIETYVLRGGDPHHVSVARIMSWASKRKTTREEDIAYCLMGLFDINMPLLYGERGKAFFRLQQEIVKTRNDQSIFAWDHQFDGEFFPLSSGAFFAPSPRAFADTGTLVSLFPVTQGNDATIEFDGKNVQMRLLMMPIHEPSTSIDTYGALDCRYSSDQQKYLGFPLQRMERKSFFRICGPLRELNLEPINATLNTLVYVREVIEHGGYFRHQNLASTGFEVTDHNILEADIMYIGKDKPDLSLLWQLREVTLTAPVTANSSAPQPTCQLRVQDGYSLKQVSPAALWDPPSSTMFQDFDWPYRSRLDNIVVIRSLAKPSLGPDCLIMCIAVNRIKEPPQLQVQMTVRWEFLRSESLAGKDLEQLVLSDSGLIEHMQVVQLVVHPVENSSKVKRLISEFSFHVEFQYSIIKGRDVLVLSVGHPNNASERQTKPWWGPQS